MFTWLRALNAVKIQLRIDMLDQVKICIGSRINIANCHTLLDYSCCGFNEMLLERSMSGLLKHVARKSFIAGRHYSRQLYAGLFKRGHVVECPCCGWHGSDFLNYRGRPSSLCPRCGSLERHRFLWLHLERNTNLVKGRFRVLHFAPEPIIRKRLRELAPDGYIDTDLYAADVSIRMDITDLLLKDNVIDCVICTHVLEHIRDDRRAIREVARVLSSSGFAVFQVPVADLPGGQSVEDDSIDNAEDRLRVFGQSDHVRKYGADIKDRLAECGMDVTVYSPYDLDDRIRLRHGLVSQNEWSGEEIYHCVKSVA